MLSIYDTLCAVMLSWEVGFKSGSPKNLTVATIRYILDMRFHRAFPKKLWECSHYFWLMLYSASRDRMFRRINSESDLQKSQKKRALTVSGQGWDIKSRFWFSLATVTSFSLSLPTLTLTYDLVMTCKRPGSIRTRLSELCTPFITFWSQIVIKINRKTLDKRLSLKLFLVLCVCKRLGVDRRLTGHKERRKNMLYIFKCKVMAGSIA